VEEEDEACGCCCCFCILGELGPGMADDELTSVKLVLGYGS
jgi:hypothetical protein